MESPSLFDIYLQYPTSIYSICHASYPHDVDKYVENLGIRGDNHEIPWDNVWKRWDKYWDTGDRTFLIWDGGFKTLFLKILRPRRDI